LAGKYLTANFENILESLIVLIRSLEPELKRNYQKKKLHKTAKTAQLVEPHLSFSVDEAMIGTLVSGLECSSE
jgi:hypothetical protein